MLKKLLTFLFCCLFLIGKAQLCQGILGDPVVHIDFGAGPNPGAPLTNNITNYTYTNGGCPSDGFYTICHSTTSCYGSWHSLATDHTGDPNGYMMLVNAATAPGVFYQDTIDLSCSNVTYEFAAWLINMNSPNECNGNSNKPNLTFNILTTTGALLQSYSTGDIPPTINALWRQVGFFFNLPGNVNRVVLQIVNNANGGCGNDLALDDITFRPCGPVVNTFVNGQAGSSIDLCKGSSSQVSFSVSVDPGYTNPAYQWQISSDNGQTWSDMPGAIYSQLPFTVAPNTATGKYLYRCAVTKPENMTQLSCRTYTQSFTVWIHEPPQVSLSSNLPICEGKPLQVQATGGVSYAWTGPAGFQGSAGEFIRVPSTVAMSGDYRVTVIDSYGCITKDTLTALIKPKPVLSLSPATQTVCRGDTVRLSASGGLNYQWSGANLISDQGANVVLAPQDSVQVQLIGSGTNGCIDTIQANVYVNKPPLASAGPDAVMVLGQQLPLSGNAGGDGIQYYWTPSSFLSNPQDLHALATPPSNYTYVLRVTSGLCGSATDTMHITVLKDIFIPDAFTPNGDGRNDVWSVLGLSLFKDFRVQVFNRYGQVVFRTTRPDSGWDGRFRGQYQNSGVYIYMVDIPSLGAHFTGNLTLIR